MQPLTSPKTQHRGCAVKMGVPVTLQPDGAWRRPAHTGPSLAKAPEGPQSPNCTRPPRWVQKQERKARRDRAPVRLVLARTAAMRSTSDEMKRGRHAMSSLSAICQSHHHHGHPIRSHSSPEKTELETGKLTTRRRYSVSFWLGKSGGEEQERTKNSSQPKMESIFQLGETFSHAHSGLNSFANRARQHLSKGPITFPCENKH